MTQPADLFAPVGTGLFGEPLAPPPAVGGQVAPGPVQPIDWNAVREREATQQADAPAPDEPDQDELRRAALREEIGVGETLTSQAARGALDALLAPGALAGLYAQGVGETLGIDAVTKFGRDLGRASSGASAAEALGFILGGGGEAGLARSEAARRSLQLQEEARPTLALMSKLAGTTAFGLALGGAAGAGSKAGATILANAAEGAAGGAQVAYENQPDAPLRDVLTSTAVGALLGGGLAAAGEGVAAGIQKAKGADLSKVFGKVQQFADERMIKTAIGNDARTMRILTDNGQDWGRVQRVAEKMREADLPLDSDEMLGAIGRHVDDATKRLSDLATGLDKAGVRPVSDDLFSAITEQTNKLRSMGTGDAQLVADAVERQVAPLRESLAIKQLDQMGNEVVTGYRAPAFTDLRRFKSSLGQALKWHKRAPSISDDAMEELYGNVARKLDAAADHAGPEVGAAWRRANQDASDWLTVQNGLEEELQRRLKNRFISPSDYAGGVTGALMAMMHSGNPLAAAGAAAVGALGHKALRLGTNKIASSLANRFARMRVAPVATTKAGGPEAQEILTHLAKTRQFIEEVAESAGDNPTVRETAANSAREVAADLMAKAAGDFDPATWAAAPLNPFAKVVHRGQILDQAAQDVAAAANKAASLRAVIPTELDPRRIAKLARDADGIEAIGGMQRAVEELITEAPATAGGSMAARWFRGAMDDLSRADTAESFAIGTRLLGELDRAAAVTGAVDSAFGQRGAGTVQSLADLTDPVLERISEKGLDDLGQLRTGMRDLSYERVRKEFASGKPPPPVEVSVYPDGTFRLQDGRHRVAVAKELGLQELPARVTRWRANGDTDSGFVGNISIQPRPIAHPELLPLKQRVLEARSTVEAMAETLSRVPDAAGLSPRALAARSQRLARVESDLNQSRAALAAAEAEYQDAASKIATVDGAERGYFERSIQALREALTSEAFGSLGRNFRALVASPDKSIEALADPAALRELLRDAPEPGAIAAAARALAQQVEESHRAAAALLGGKPKTPTELKDWVALAEKAEEATTIDGGAMSRMVTELGEKTRPFTNPETAVLETVGAEVEKVVPILKAGALGKALQSGRALPGTLRIPKSPPPLAPAAQQERHEKRLDQVARSLANPDQLQTDKIQGGPEVAAAAAERLQNLLNEMPKPVETIRGKQSLSSDQLRLANAMWEATMEPLSVFGDFARGNVDYDKVKYAWRQYPGLQQAAQAGVMDVLTHDLSSKERENIPDPMLSQLDYLLGFGGKLQPNVDPEFSMRMSALPPQEQKDQPKPGGMLDSPGAKPTFTQRLAGAS